MNKQILKAIDYIKENKVYGVKVSLHIHNEEEYKGEHTIFISVEKEKNNHLTYSVDLFDFGIEELRLGHQKIFQEIKNVYPQVKQSEHVYN